jgi:hypothetical protein
VSSEQIGHVYARLPEKFVVKSTKGSGRNVLVHTKAEWPPRAIAAELRGYDARWPNRWEPQYEHVTARLVVEPMIMPIPDDYKVVVCKGRCTVAWIDRARHTQHKRNVYRINDDDTLTPMDECVWEYPPDRAEVSLGNLPTHKVREMCATAQSIASEIGLDLVRVDLYLIDGVFYAGEATLTSEAFMARISEHCANVAIGLDRERVIG